jgi:hypothetical protein
MIPTNDSCTITKRVNGFNTYGLNQKWTVFFESNQKGGHTTTV